MNANVPRTYSVSYEDAAGIVTARVQGEATHDDHVAAREEATRMCQDKHCSRLLVDLHDLRTDRSSTLDCLVFGRSMAKALQGLRIAFVIPSDNRSINDLRFTLTVGEHPDVIVEQFTSADDARGWLLRGS